MPSPQYAREIPRRYRMEASRCAACTRVAFPPERVCSHCRGTNIAKFELGDQGRLLSWSVVHAAPDIFGAFAPYIVGLVELDGGARVTAQLVDCDAAELSVGLSLRRVLRRLRSEGKDGIIHYGYKFVLNR